MCAYPTMVLFVEGKPRTAYDDSETEQTIGQQGTRDWYRDKSIYLVELSA